MRGHSAGDETALKEYLYETHVHTSPVSRCAVATPEETVTFYREMGYDGLFLTNHFLDGNIGIDFDRPYAEKIEFYFSDYEKALQIGREQSFKVFPGVELSYGGTDFLIYGLDKAWYLAHPEIMTLSKREELALMKSAGAFIVQAHPFRERDYIDHIRLYPRSVEAVEVLNLGNSEQANRMAELYAAQYGLAMVAGTDNHMAGAQRSLAGIKTQTPLCSVEDYIDAVRTGKTEIFRIDR